MTPNSNVAILEEAQDIVLLFQFHLNFVLHTRMEYAGVQAHRLKRFVFKTPV